MALVLLVVVLVWATAKTKEHVAAETILCLPASVCVFMAVSRLGLSLPWNRGIGVYG